MRILQGLRSIARQTFQTRTEEGETLTLTKYYSPVSQAWFLDVVSENFTVYGIRITLVVNLLEQYTNLIRWGITVLSSDGAEPFLLNDFSSGRIQLAILNFEELQFIETQYLAGNG